MSYQNKLRKFRPDIIWSPYFNANKEDFFKKHNLHFKIIKELGLPSVKLTNTIINENSTRLFNIIINFINKELNIKRIGFKSNKNVYIWRSVNLNKFDAAKAKFLEYESTFNKTNIFLEDYKYHDYNDFKAIINPKILHDIKKQLVYEYILSIYLKEKQINNKIDSSFVVPYYEKLDDLSTAYNLTSEYKEIDNLLLTSNIKVTRVNFVLISLNYINSYDI